MVKNFGGNRAKKQARKFVTAGASATVIRTRFSEDNDELYACCSKHFGNGMCEVKCIDGKTRLCIIRKKFKGRRKRDNNVVIGTWILVGIRSYEVLQNGKQEKCDLLEVYNDNNKEQLLKHSPQLPWNLFRGITSEEDPLLQDPESIGASIKFQHTNNTETLPSSNMTEPLGNNVEGDDRSDEDIINLDDI